MYYGIESGRTGGRCRDKRHVLDPAGQDLVAAVFGVNAGPQRNFLRGTTASALTNEFEVADPTTAQQASNLVDVFGGRARLAFRTNSPRTIGVTFRKSFSN